MLHPELDSSSCVWHRNQPVAERRYKLDAEGKRRLENSPIRIVYYEGQQVRYRLESPPQPDEFPIITDLRAEGCTDYLALPLPFSDGSWKAITFVTRRAGGFSEEDIARLERLVPTLARILEIQTLHRTILTLLDTYVGAIAGQRVRDGVIKRGMCETIKAVIWFCDLRGFTELSETLSGADLVRLLNDFFGAMTAAVGQTGPLRAVCIFERKASLPSARRDGEGRGLPSQALGVMCRSRLPTECR
jgi:adenylate cyclase